MDLEWIDSLCDSFARSPDLILMFVDATAQNYQLGEAASIALNEVSHYF